MISKFALAFKTKTIEFFAEEDEEDDAATDTASIATLDLSTAPEEIITGQRVVVLKPDPPPPRPSPDTVISAVFSAVSAFRSAYLQLQAAHSPLDSNAVITADSNAVSQLQLISELKREFYSSKIESSYRNCGQDLNFLEAQVKENQTLLRMFENVFNRLQADIDRKDSEVANLKIKFKETEAENLKLGRMLKKNLNISVGKVESLLTVGLFDCMVKDCCKEMHKFSKLVIGFMKKSRLDFVYVGNLVYPNVKYAKFEHWKYAVLSYICLGMFDGFESDTFCCENDGIVFDVEHRRRKSMSEFIEHLSIYHLELVRRSPDSDFARFCTRKYEKLISKCMECSIFGNLERNDSLLRTLKPSNFLYQSFIDMASSVWLLHKLAQAYDPEVEIFQVGRGKEFSIVFMESTVRSVNYGKVGFTVVPGFKVGKTVIQCLVYLEGLEEEHE